MRRSPAAAAHVSATRPARVRHARSGRPMRLSMEERHHQLIETAAHVFAEHGFKGTTTRQLARAAGVTEAVIFQHFADKDALYAAVLARKTASGDSAEWLDRLEAAARRSDDEVTLRTLYEHILDVHERDASFARLMVYSALEHHELARGMQDAHSQRLYRILEAYIRSGQADGRFRDGEPAVLVRAVLALPVYYVLQRGLFRPAWPAADRDALIRTGVAFTLAGLSRPSSAARNMSRRAPLRAHA